MRKIPFAHLFASCGIAALLMASSGCQLIASFDRSLIPSGEEGDAATDAAGDANELEDGSVDGQGPGADASDGASEQDASDSAAPVDAGDAGQEQDANDAASEQDANDAASEQDANDAASGQDANDAASEEDANDGAAADAADANDLCTGVVCTASDQCHVAGTCDPSTGQCSNPAATNGITCADANLCDVNPTCQSGVCTPTSEVVCTASDQCHTAGTCTPATGTCTNPAATNGISCTDSNLCDLNPTCQAGTCTATSHVTCTASDQCHTAGTCTPATGTCTNPAATNGISCTDSNLCDLNPTCQAGACTATSHVTCTASDQCHVAGTCTPATGTCTNPTATDGITCTDSNLCDLNPKCQAGTCTPTSTVTCTASDQCHVAGTCTPATGTCTNPTATDGITCTDSNLCDLNPKCQAGTCTPTSTVTCTASDQCHVAGTCTPATGTCTNPNATDGITCTDSNLCDLSPKCQAGACTPTSTVTCTASDQCHTVGTCTPATGTCTNPAASDGLPCNDGNKCDQNDTCQSGSCASGGAVTCSAGFSCNPSNGCVSIPLATAAITEFQAFATTPPNVGQFVEIQNPSTGSAGDLANATLSDGTSTVTIHPATDPTGQSGTSLILSPGDIVWGVANPTSAASIPTGASFVWGSPGTTYALNDAGPKMILTNAASVALATVDASASFVTDPTKTVAAGDFPGFTGKSTQWDSTLGAATDGSNWCVTFRGADTRGAANQSCGGEVINEVLEHYASPGAGVVDASNTFIEIAAPGGANLANISINYVDNSGATAGTAAIPPGTRANVIGFYVIADGTSNGGSTNVPNANLVLGAGTPLNGSAGGVALVLMPAVGTTPLDTLAYGAGGPVADLEGTPIASITPLDVAISYSRDANSTDTNDNAADFHDDPSPTPGETNTAVNPTIVSPSVSDGLDDVATPVSFDARDVADVAAINGVAPTQTKIVGGFDGNQDTACSITAGPGLGVASDLTVTCTAPTNSGTSGRGALSLTSPTGLGIAVATITNGWTYTGVDNGTPSSVGYCQIDAPLTPSMTLGGAAPALFGEVYEANDTENGLGTTPAILAQVGFGPSGSDPTAVAGWSYVTGSYVGQTGTSDHNNQFQGTLSPILPATYAFVWRFSLDGGLTYTYCDSTTNGPALFNIADLGTLTVSP